MTIKRNNVASLDEEQRRETRYCPRCEEDFHIQRLLKPRIYKEDEIPEPDKWLQCYYCGRIVAKWEAKEEGHIEAVVSIQQNPFDPLSGKMQGIDSGRSAKRGQIGRKHRRVEQYKDPEINQAIKHGAKVLSYSEQ